MNTPSSSFQTASSALPVGTRLAEFEITGVIGEGGFGIVYSAHDSSLERIVAIKEYLPSAFAQRGDIGVVQVKSEDHRKTFTAGLASFINEARMLAKFPHPGLVEVFRFWEANGTAYMAMRYYRGVTLREALRTSPELITEQWLCETLDPILLALKELHDEKCYHRDIAPDNILVLPNGRSVLMDFGAARRIISGMTQALTTVLKPGYAPIEQYYDDGSMQQGAWTDIYALGGLLYHVMTGKVPVQAISRMISDPLKPVSEVATRDFSPRLCSAVMKCLEVLPENRYQSVDELRAALGWVTMPVISTVIHKPLVAEPVEQYPATVIISGADIGRIMASAGNAPATSVAPSLVVEPDATVITPHARVPEPVPVQVHESEFSIDALIGAPVAEPQSKPATMPTSSAKPEVKSTNDLSSTKKDAKSGLKAAVVAGVVVLVALAGFFLFGAEKKSDLAVSPPSSQPAEVVIATTPAPVPIPQPSVPTPAAEPLPVTLAASATDAPAVQEASGTLRIELKGGWGTVFIDGEQKGIVPPVLAVKVSAGTHDIEIRNPAVPTERRSVTVNAGKTTVVRHAFAK